MGSLGVVDFVGGVCYFGRGFCLRVGSLGSCLWGRWFWVLEGFFLWLYGGVLCSFGVWWFLMGAVRGCCGGEVAFGGGFLGVVLFFLIGGVLF